MRMRDIDRAINAVERAQQTLERIDKTYPKKYKKELERIGYTVITRWYNSYITPIYYRRQESLYHAFKVELINQDVRVSFDYSYLDAFTHNVSNEYIYENSFIQGYHGGATSGEGHPSPGIPYWRTPIPSFGEWGRPAKASLSPYYEMKRLMNQKIRELDNEKDSIWGKELKNMRRCISKLI